MALQSSTLRNSENASPGRAEWHEAWRNVDDYLKALNLSETLRIHIAEQIFAEANSASVADPVRFAMERLFENAFLQRILLNATQAQPEPPEIGRSSMLPERMEFTSGKTAMAATGRWLMAWVAMIFFAALTLLACFGVINFIH